jgi:signal transduction histidine kinase
MVKSDQKRFKQILFNLIGNAVKFTFQGNVKVAVSYKNQILKTSVSDTGIGIKLEEQ